MQSFDFEAVTYDSDIYCVGCLPDGVSTDSDEVSPIFADSEWDETPICCACGTEHDYVTVLESEDESEEDEIEEDEEDTPQEGDLYTEDFNEFYEVSASASGFRRFRSPVLTVEEGQEWQEAVTKYQMKEGYFGNVWRVDDHGGIELAGR